MSVANRDGERVGCIRIFEFGPRQQHPDHQVDLDLVSVTDTNNGFLYRVWCIFMHDDAPQGRNEQAEAPCLTQFQCRSRILVDKYAFYRCSIRLVARQNRVQLVKQAREAHREIIAF